MINLPLGAEHLPNAPWNEKTKEPHLCQECNIEIENESKEYCLGCEIFHHKEAAVKEINKAKEVVLLEYNIYVRDILDRAIAHLEKINTEEI